jgi:hypothetical protein
MLSSILKLISAKIEIEVSPDRFVFRRNNEVKSLTTKIYLSSNSAKALVLGIGDEFIPTQPNVCVELFRDSQEIELPTLAKSECLDAFFRHAFRMVTRRSIMIRPQVVFKNSESLHNLLCGYQDSILMAAAIDAGARECIFEGKNNNRLTAGWSWQEKPGG